MKKMKKFFCLVMIFFLSITILAGCSSSTGSKDGGSSDNASTKVALVLNGTLGDLAFFDSAAQGLEMAKEEYGIEGQVFEAGFDRTKWKSTLYDIASEDWDLIITGTFDMAEITSEVAEEFPEKKFIHFDASVDYSDGKNSNVYSMEYKYNEGAFLAGYVAAAITQTDKIGGIGAMSIPAVNDYLIGYIEGAKHKNPDIDIEIKYTDNFNDSALGKELALLMYNSGADIVANGASISGLGIIDAAKETGKYVIGSDSDQALLFKESDPEKAETMVTSVMKRIDLSIVRAIGMYLDDTLPFGQSESLGMNEDAIDIADNEYYQQYVPEDVRNQVNEIENKILAGEIEVPTAYGMTNEDIDSYINN